MTRTAKKCCIFFICSTWLLVCRIVLSYLPLSDNLSDWVFSFSAQVIGMGVIPVLLYAFWVKEDPLNGLCVKMQKKIPSAVWGLLIVVVILAPFVTRGVSSVWQSALRLIGYTHVNSVGTIYSDPFVLVMDILVTACLPAVFEELTDRGLLSSALGEMPDGTKMVVMALFFGLAHQNVVQTGYTFVGGLVFSYLFLKTKSIVPGMIVHFANNFYVVVDNYLDQTSGLYKRLSNLYSALVNRFYLLFLVLCALAAVALYFVLREMGRIMDAREGPKEERQEPRAWYEYAFLFGAGTMMVLTTVFTAIWGIWR